MTKRASSAPSVTWRVNHGLSCKIEHPRVAIVHDYLTQRGGAERVALELAKIFPGSRLVTSIFEPRGTFEEFRHFDVETLWIDRSVHFRRDPRLALPLLAPAFASHVINDVDLVVCSSSGWAHLVRTTAPKLVYCHNPPRWLYQAHDYLLAAPRGSGAVLRVLSPLLRFIDRWGANNCEAYVANSRVVQERVHQAYGIQAHVINPPPGLSEIGGYTPVAGIPKRYFLTVGRPRGYKNTDIVIEAFARLKSESLVVIGAEGKSNYPNVTHLAGISDEQLRWLYKHCTAIAAMSHEDFGLTPVEGYCFSKPTIALAAGGFLETVIPGQTGEFVYEESPKALAQVVADFRSGQYDPTFIKAWGDKFSKANFASSIMRIASELVQPGRSSVNDISQHNV